MVMSVVFVDTFEYFAHDLLQTLDNFGSCDLQPSLNSLLARFTKSIGPFIDLIVALLCSCAWP